jgi:hypothetical protein
VKYQFSEEGAHSMSSYLIVAEVSSHKMVLKFVQSECRTVLAFAVPDHWSVGDTVALEINRAPYRAAFDSEGKVLFSLPKELPNGLGKQFYRLRNERTKEIIGMDFDCIKGFESIAREAKRRNLMYPVDGKNKKLARGSREL